MGYTRSMDHRHAVADLVGDEINDDNTGGVQEEELYNGANGLRKKVQVQKKEAKSRVLSCIHNASRSKISVISIHSIII